jgi:hypothetical protein
MPRVRRQDVPPALLQHLLDRVQSRKIPASQLELLAKWLDREPEVPEGQATQEQSHPLDSLLAPVRQESPLFQLRFRHERDEPLPVIQMWGGPP